MISQVMAYCKQHFDRSREAQAFEVVADGITGTFIETYVVGQYIWMVGSFINDGVYKISGVTTSKLTLDATLTAEDTGEIITLYGLSVPKAFLDIVTDIDSWVSGNSGKEGLASESIDGYSVSFGTGADGSTSNTPEFEDYEFVIPDFFKFTGKFQITSLEYAGEYNGEATYSVSFESAGIIVVSAS